ncbi:MAG: hypothetical protein JST89_13975 [Cyanobacteria bacterium SZAS-4]|nr:hypothetical protein [Cyanobacteria bacterium SZAS-4]
MIGALGKENAFTGSRDNAEIAEIINQAILHKSSVDPELKTKTILLLHIPSAIGQIARQDLQQRSFDLKGFRVVWISPFQEECFEVINIPSETTS